MFTKYDVSVETVGPTCCNGLEHVANLYTSSSIKCNVRYIHSPIQARQTVDVLVRPTTGLLRTPSLDIDLEIDPRVTNASLFISPIV